jgi:hypothetical protein
MNHTPSMGKSWLRTDDRCSGNCHATVVSTWRRISGFSIVSYTSEAGAIELNHFDDLPFCCTGQRRRSTSASSTPVCIENLIRIDLVRESLNVDHNGRADIRHL